MRGLARFWSRLRWRPTHRHRKGGLYRVITRGVWEPERRAVVIYDDADGITWVRPADEFDDGRFTPLDQVATGGRSRMRRASAGVATGRS